MNRETKTLGVKILCVSLLLTTASNSFAIIRSPYPVKPLPPYRGNVIIIGGDSIVVPAESAPATTAKPAK